MWPCNGHALTQLVQSIIAIFILGLISTYITNNQFVSTSGSTHLILTPFHILDFDIISSVQSKVTVFLYPFYSLSCSCIGRIQTVIQKVCDMYYCVLFDHKWSKWSLLFFTSHLRPEEGFLSQIADGRLRWETIRHCYTIIVEFPSSILK